LPHISGEVAASAGGRGRGWSGGVTFIGHGRRDEDHWRGGSAATAAVLAGAADREPTGDPCAPRRPRGQSEPISDSAVDAGAAKLANRNVGPTSPPADGSCAETAILTRDLVVFDAAAAAPRCKLPAPLRPARACSTSKGATTWGNTLSSTPLGVLVGVRPHIARCALMPGSPCSYWPRFLRPLLTTHSAS